MAGSTQSFRIALPATASLHYNNLTCGNAVLVYAHLGSAYTIDEAAIAFAANHPLASDPAAAIRPNLPPLEVACEDVTRVYQVRVCCFGHESYVALSTGASIQVWNRGGTRLLFSFVVPNSVPRGASPPVDGSGAERPTVVRGICSVLARDDSKQICAGASTGAIFAFDCKGGRFRHSATLKEHLFPLVDLGSEYDGHRGTIVTVARHLLSADQEGNIVVWDAHSASQYARKLRIGGTGSPCVGVSARANRLVCAYARGLIQLYDLATECLQLEIEGHSRWLSSFAMHPIRDIFVTVAEDTTLNVWTLPSDGKKVEVVLSAMWKDAMLTGVTFCGPDSQFVATTAYDHDRLHVWKLPR